MANDALARFTLAVARATRPVQPDWGECLWTARDLTRPSPFRALGYGTTLAPLGLAGLQASIRAAAAEQARVARIAALASTPSPAALAAQEALLRLRHPWPLS